MSAYPDSFTTTCIGHLPCGAMQFCTTRNAPVVVKNGEPVAPSKISYETQTPQCLPNRAPCRIIQDNVVDFPAETRHNWSNQRGYGNIVVATNAEQCNNIYGKVYPWNRIPPLSQPTDTQVDTQMAWSNRNVCPISSYQWNN